MTNTLENTSLEALDLEEAARPKAPPIGQGQHPISKNSRQLRAIHRHHLMEIGRARAVLSHIQTGHAGHSALQEVLDGMSLTENMAAFGTLCGRECQMLQFHHDAEEGHMFPTLHDAGNEGLRAVVEKLQREHLIVHELLRRLSLSAQKLAQSPTDELFTDAHAIFDKLEAVIRSHFSYEETELAEALDHLLSQL